jgi:formylaminopyrimidine deformylase / aminopyrimidine aminohydrolase
MTVRATALQLAHKEMWRQIPVHPFLVAAGDGSLTPAAFGRWLVEDNFFVVGFRRFLGRLVALAPDEAARDRLAGGFAALRAELELFRREAAARGLRLDDEPGPTTLGYTSYLAAALDDGYDVGLAVLYGAEKAYFDGWSAVRSQVTPASPYWAFIDNWSSRQFGEWVDAIAGLLGGGEPTPAQLEAFGRVVRFELRFWSAVHLAEVW